MNRDGWYIKAQVKGNIVNIEMGDAAFDRWKALAKEYTGKKRYGKRVGDAYFHYIVQTILEDNDMLADEEIHADN